MIEPTKRLQVCANTRDMQNWAHIGYGDAIGPVMERRRYGLAPIIHEMT